MKQCPVCKTTYTDDTLRYCLADGTTLVDGPLTEETVIRTTARDAVRVPIERDEPVSFSPNPPIAAAPRVSSGKGFKVFLVVAIILILFAGGVAIASLILYNNLNKGTANTNVAKSPSPGTSASPSPTVDPEKQRLQDELANLQKKLDQQKNTNANVVTPPPPPTPNRGAPTARVNSPSDGFLALRSEPDADYGERIAKIPHGAVVEINNCERSKVKISGRSGRWCQITYNGQTGYVFDAWLIY
jgi:hypothetical protein